jgi:hypothetical protein
MKVEQLIKALEALPKDADVYHLWDGEARTGINYVWLSRGGDVVTADYGMVCYSEETRPAASWLSRTTTSCRQMLQKSP